MRVELRWMAPRRYYEPQGWEWIVEQRVGDFETIVDNHGNFLQDTKEIIEMMLNVNGYYGFSFTIAHEDDILISTGVLVKL